MYKSIILPSAKKDMQAAAKWYNAEQSGLGKKFLAEIRSKNQLLKLNPFAYSVRYEQVRVANLNAFPYMIHFTVEENTTILISAILHTKLSPSSWPVS